ncbi:MAG: hypothetical protein FWE67_13100 [Planctomycetaceae bacterium]|nr:hypothetical protein [Planctomycetaceae bacterium]
MRFHRFVLISVSFLVLFAAAIENLSAAPRVFRNRTASYNSSGNYAKQVAAQAAVKDAKINAFVSVSERFLTVPFMTERTEDVDISEMINGVRTIGSGVMVAKSTGDVVSGFNRAVISVNLDGVLNSNTVGKKSVVTAHSETTTHLHGVKNIYITSEGITTSRAAATASQNSNLTGMSIQGGKIVRHIAKQAAAEQRPVTEAIGRQRTRVRFENRLDVQIGERIAEVNANYQKKFREPLMMQNQYPQVFNLSSTEDRLNAFFTFGNEQQPVADSDIPLNVPQNDVLFQIHQSAVNNFTATAFAGKIFDEEKIAEYAKDPGSPFYFFAGLLSRNAEEKPLIVKFAEENPIDVSFSGNTIKAVIRADAFAQDGKQHPGLEVTLSYSVKKEGTKIILEQTAAPVVGSREGKRVGASQTVIQTIVKRRLAKLETRRVLQELEPKGEWEGKGKLVPAFADSQNGWFALSYNWVEK